MNAYAGPHDPQAPETAVAKANDVVGKITAQIKQCIADINEEISFHEARLENLREARAIYLRLLDRKEGNEMMDATQPAPDRKNY